MVIDTPIFCMLLPLLKGNFYMSKPTSTEEEYFAREEAEKKKRLALKLAAETAQAEKERLKKLHWLRCPKCGMELSPILFKGVTIDKCFHCNGVYLDDGELEKLAGTESGF